ncbi:hypothetical protein VKT23_015890 [Stygiomarasmius scandens]|uniref:BRCT domain-containing protein n=1 Tax=Marasmiellus scandens TaxID=2682957 RepID=A0ABR1IZN2_9AGAR
MCQNNPSEFRGCSPKLFSSVGPLGTAGYRYKYYLLQDGIGAGIYADQKTASSLARKTGQPEPKGFRKDQEQLINEQWMYHCSKVHEHPPSEMLLYVDPFMEAQPDTGAGSQVHWEEEMAEALQMTQTLTFSIPSQLSTPHRSQGRAPLLPHLSRAAFAKVDLAKLNSDARPNPVNVNSNARPYPVSVPDAGPPGPSNVHHPDYLSGAASPSLQSPSKGKARASSRSPSPSKEFWRAFANEDGSEDASSENEEPTKYYVVQYVGGADFYTASDEAFKALKKLDKCGLKPALRSTTNFKLAEEFAKKVR